MSILGIDFGLRHVGVALSPSGILAEPLMQIIYRNERDLFEKIKALIGKHGVKKIVIGISEGKMAEKTKRFGEKLSSKTKIPVIYQDETLSSIEVSKKMVTSGAPRKKRQTKSHQAAAAMILQDFLDENKKYC